MAFQAPWLVESAGALLGLVERDGALLAPVEKTSRTTFGQRSVVLLVFWFVYSFYPGQFSG